MSPAAKLLRDQLASDAPHWRENLLPNQRQCAKLMITKLCAAPEVPLSLKQIHCELTYVPATIVKAANYLQSKFPKLFAFSRASGKQKPAIGTIKCIDIARLNRAITVMEKPS